MNESSNKTMLIVGMLVAGLAVGGLIGYSAGDMKDDDNSNMTSNSTQMDKSESPDGVTVGGAKMVKDLDIVDNAVNAKNVTTLVAAVKGADLVETLKGEGPFTVFGPTNAAFDKLPAGTVETLLKPESKADLTKILTYHVVPGTYTSADLKVMASKGESLTSVQGDMLMPVMQDNKLMLKDAKGNVVGIETTDVISSNGVTHVIDAVLMPN